MGGHLNLLKIHKKLTHATKLSSRRFLGSLCPILLTSLAPAPVRLNPELSATQTSIQNILISEAPQQSTRGSLEALNKHQKSSLLPIPSNITKNVSEVTENLSK